MKKFIASVLATILIGSTLNLQAQSDKNTSAKQSAIKYAEAIDLNSDQESQMEVILTEFYNDAKANFDSNKSDSQAYKAGQKSIFQDADAKIKAMLTEEQMTSYQKKKFELRKEVLEHYLKDKVEK